MALSGRKLRRRQQKLRRAITAGDPAAMWAWAVLLLGLTEQERSHRGNLLPFLTAVGEAARRAQAPEAASLIRRAADAGDTRAMVVLATWLLGSDAASAEKLLVLAAERGDAAAMLRLGTLLAADDPAQAHHWLSQLAEAGDEAGAYELSVLLAQEDPAGALSLLRRAAAAGHTPAQNDLAVRAFIASRDPLDPARPPAADPMRTDLFTPSTPYSRHARHVSACRKCGRDTVQDDFEFIIGRWYGLGSPGTAGKTGDRVHFSTCVICACLFPLDEPSLEYVQDRGGDWFDPAVPVART